MFKKDNQEKKILYRVYFWNNEIEKEGAWWIVDIPKTDKLIMKQYSDDARYVERIERWEIGQELSEKNSLKQ